jgi:hypothetical protein
VEQLAGTFSDSLSERAALPISQTLYPLGFPLEITTNSAEVVAAAAESWGSYPGEFEREPIRIRAIVEPRGEADPLPPVYRSQHGLVAIVSDRGNFAACDLAARFGWCQISANTLAARRWFRWYFLEAMTYILLSHSDVTLVHAGCVARQGRGLLLCGSSGSGKSTLAYACARAGWTYITDDGTALLQDSPHREARAKQSLFRFRPEAVALFPELGGYRESKQPNGKPTIEVPPSAFSEIATASRCRIECIVFLDRRKEGGAALRPLASSEALGQLMREMPDYGDLVRHRQEETLANLVAAPAYELRYHALADAIALLQDRVEESR